MLSGSEIRQIVSNARTIWERIDYDWHGELSTAPAKETDSRLEEWLEAAAEGDPEKFRRKLEFDNITEKTARRILEQVDIRSEFEYPDWAIVLDQVTSITGMLSHTAVSPDPSEHFPYLDKESPVPFEELLLPFIEITKTRLDEILTSIQVPSHDAVRTAFERSLLIRLSQMAARVLQVEFRTHVACLQFSTAPIAKSGGAVGSRVDYLSYTANFYSEGWAPIFKEYCVLARLLGQAVLNSIEITCDFLVRLDRDLPKIADTFTAGQSPGKIIRLETDLADSHNRNRSVALAEFSSGLKLIYKPKCLELELAYFRFTNWINELQSIPTIRTLKILSSTDYGWIEFVEHRSCKDEEEIRRYYRRTGNLLCLIHALNGIDFHYENLIADGEHPVPIDLETIFHNRSHHSFAEKTDPDEITRKLRESVLSTDFLPDPVKTDHHYYDVSALARSIEEVGPLEELEWINTNTDGMDYRLRSRKPKPAANLPQLNGTTVLPDNYINEITGGFRDAYQLIINNQAVLLSVNGPLQQLFTNEGRFIFRSTAFYAATLKKALHPDYLRNGIDMSIQLDVLSRSLLKQEEKPSVWPLIRAEAESLLQLDIPRFLNRGDNELLVLPSGEIIDGCIRDSAWSQTKRKISNFNEDDLRWQISLIIGSMDVRHANLSDENQIEQWTIENNQHPPLPDQEELLESALLIARKLEEKAYRLSNGDIGWMVLQYSQDAKQYNLKPMDHDLYNGRAGVGLFFAAMHKVFPKSGFGDLAVASLAPVQRWMNTATTEDISHYGLGGYSGIASMVYALTRAGEWMHNLAMVEDARTGALRITHELIDNAETMDAMGGVAGLIPCLLRCHSATNDSRIIEIAVYCGQTLLDKRKGDASGFLSWPTVNGIHMTGFAHGASGIIYALLKLYQITNNRSYLDAAEEGIQFEKYYFDRNQGNWLDLRVSKNQSNISRFKMAWCHGAPGISLGRIGAVDVYDTPSVRDEIVVALDSASRTGLLRRDHLCCGNAGIIDTFLTAGTRLHNPEWKREAMMLAARISLRAQRNKGFAVAFKNDFFNPSLFQGSAGIGYEMLRLAKPEDIPSVLLLE